MAEKHKIQSVAKAITLLNILSDSAVPLSLSELTEKIAMPKTTVFGLLSTMRDFSVIEQNENGKYQLGFRLFEYGCTVSSLSQIIPIAKPYLEELSQKTKSSAILSTYNNGKIIILDQAQSHGGLRVVSDVGSKIPIHCTSQGKLFLSDMTSAKINNILKSYPLTMFTPHTIITPHDLSKEISLIKKNGYSIENGEYKIGLRSVSAPIYDSSGSIKYTLTIVDMFRRIDSEDFLNAKKLVVSYAKDISDVFGWKEC